MNDNRIHKSWRLLGMTAAQNLAGVTDVAFHSMHRKGNQCKLLVVHSKTIDVVSCFTVLSGDRHHDDT